MVRPDLAVTISPGLLAVLLGMFSQAAIRPMTGRLRPWRAMARKVPSTLAAPHMSYFISSILLAGLIEIPPESKVNPLPTSTMGAASLFSAGVYLSSINTGGWAEPLATDRKALILRASI